MAWVQEFEISLRNSETLPEKLRTQFINMPPKPVK